MREIKFRAWDGEKMYRILNLAIKTGSFHIINTEYETHELRASQNAVDVMQYTGLKDSNGVDIYEGDILRFRETDLDDWDIAAVRYMSDRDYPAFDFEPDIHTDSNGLSYAIAECDIEIIGNIHQNQELMEAK